MEIILKEDISGLGYKNDVVKVRNGYGRNFLIPRGLALMATDSAKRVVAENVKQVAHKAEKLKTDAQNLADRIGETVLNLYTKAGESGKIFGAITTLQIADELKSKGFDVDRKKVSFRGEVKSVGQYTVLIDLHKEVKKEIIFNVIAE
jgi:large subunit ribosomal protein L9